MREETIVRETVRAFCDAWFVRRDAVKAASFLTDEVGFVGTGDHECAQGKAEMAEYIREDIGEIREPFSCELSVLHEQSLSEHVRSLSGNVTLTNSLYTWRLRGFFTMQESGGVWRVRSLHFAEPGRSQRGREHYPQTLVMETIKRQRMEFLSGTLPGGMMGGYLEEGFPFYFVNLRMLDYLGYADEAEFVADIGGSVSNCMHPDDRDMVDAAVARQLNGQDEYVVEYRMKKKDGAYIWVHDVGQKITAEDGRGAICSVCIDITAQKTAQEELDRLYNNIPGAVFRCRFDADFSVLDANDGLFAFLGYTREEFAGMGNKMSAVIHPDDLAVMADILNAQLQHGTTIHNENRLICKDGTVRWISINAQLFTEEGERYFYCVFVDITDEKKLQRQVREHYEQELSCYSELSSDVGSIQGRFNLTTNRLESYVATSDVAGARWGATYDGTIERFAASAMDAGYGEEIRRVLARQEVIADYAAGKRDYRFDFLRLRRDGEGGFWCNTSFRSAQNPETGDVMLFFYTADVTEKKMQERMLSQIAELDYDILTDVDMVRDTYRLISLNGAYKDLIPPRGRYQSVLRTIAGASMGPDVRELYLKRLDYGVIREELSQQDAYSFVIEMRSPRGEMEVKRVQVFYISKELGRLCVACTDVTDVVRQEQRQREDMAAALAAAEQANAAKTDFLSRMSHEIRTPMNAIIGMSTIAAQCIGQDERVANCISKIGISSRYLLSLINDILDMSRIESGKMLLKSEKIPTEEFLSGINSICYSQAAAKGVDYECILDPVLDDCYLGDSMKLQQVLVNILGNAIKFTGEGGKVTFSASQHRRTKHDAVLRFIINDTGVGMSEDFLPHIFEPFTQESTGTTAIYGGTGLGLAISKNIVDLMDGSITVRSIKGTGTEFTVEVKLGLMEEAELRRRQKHTYNFSCLKTMVVDDDIVVCENAVATLREMGVAAEWIDSGRKAVERVRELWDQKKHYDMILIDWKMPDMDGIETARRIRAIVGSEVTIIIMTAYDWASIEQEAKLAGVNLLMDKPMFKSSLISAFNRALGEKEEPPRAEDAAEYDFTGECVLLAEDNAINTEVAVMLLESKGFAVETAENGLRAMELFSKSTEGYYSAILMDIRMPLMDGLTAAVNIRNLSNRDARTIPIIAMTANAFDDDVEKSKAAGMNAHLAKPIDPQRLYQTLHDLIAGKEA